MIVLQKSADIYKTGGKLDPAGFEEKIIFQTYVPPADLTPFINHFWTIRWNNTTGQSYISEQVMHRPYVDIFLSAHESGIQCTFRDKRDYEAANTGRIIGARFKPGAFHAFWRKSMTGLHNETIALEQVFAEAGPPFIENTLSLQDDAAVGALAEMLHTQNPQYDPNIEIINRIIVAIETDRLQTVGDVAQWIGKSERWLQQLFQEYIGTGIKWQLKRNKLLDAAKLIRECEHPNWADMAYDLGYSSQQHFITDFKCVLGKTPLQYKKELGLQTFE
ncbi:helix-turn-helix domain-containing protein [Paenibacillus gorillae]|uniref:helix-turn-helix domain-containing protein n=1 Tax=Paenibacillus gorillae TaxID=1243662 RepID=UPI0004AFD330|nr:AraC family transcriptional regulator [Paenibacillus gorillae]